MFKILTILLLLFGSSYAATFNVSTTAEFRQALSDAAGNGEDDTIVLADGVYKTTDDGGGTFPGLFASIGDNMNLTITNESSGAILDGNNQNDIIFEIQQINKLTLKNITFQNTLGEYAHGMALSKILNLSIQDCAFQNLTSSAMFIHQAQTLNDMDVNITDSSFESISGGLGAISISNDIVKNLQISDSQFDSLSTFAVSLTDSNYDFIADISINGSAFRNFSSSKYALYFRASNLIIKDTLFENNSYEGAINYLSNGDLSLINSQFNANSSSVNQLGNELYVVNSANVLIYDSQFTNSSSFNNDSFFIAFHDTTNVIIDRTLFSGIKSNLQVIGMWDTDFLLVNSIMKDNESKSYPLGSSSSQANINIINSMFQNNKSSQNGDASFSTYGDHSIANIINTFVLNNGIQLGTYQGRETIIYNSSIPAYTSIGTPVFYSNIDMPTGSYSIAGSSFSFDYIDILDDQNISLVDNSYVYNKGIALDSSEIVEIIDNSVFSEYLAQNSQYDFLGNPRIVGSGIDVGPIEYLSTPAPPSIPTDLNASDGTIEFAVGVSWTGVANVNHYNVYRSTSQADTGEIVGVITGTSFVDDTVEENTKYYYRVTACNDEGCSDYSVVDSGYIGTISTAVNPAIIMYLLN